MLLAYFWYCDIYSLSSRLYALPSFLLSFGSLLEAGLDEPFDPFDLIRSVSKGYQAAPQRCSDAAFASVFSEWCARSLFPFEIYSAFKGEFGLIDATHVHRFYESLRDRRIERASSPSPSVS